MTASDATSALPLAAGEWTLDKNHSGVNFRVRHLGLSNIHGRFDRFTATLTVGATLDDIAITSAIDMTSVNTNHPDRDAHLRSTDFFSTDQHPEMTFHSTSIRIVGSDEYELSGVLAINGHEQAVTFRVEFNGLQEFPADGKVHAGFSAVGDVNRDEFGIDFNLPLGMDKMAVGQKVRVELEMQFLAP